MQYEKGVGVFIIRSGKILLMKRVKAPFAGYWEVPAGKVIEKESFEECVKREVLEETNLVVDNLEEIGVNINHENHFESRMFIAKTFFGELKNKEIEKHSEIKWFDLGGLPKNMGSTTAKGVDILKRRRGQYIQ